MPCGRRWRSFVPHSIHRWLTDLEHTACGLRRPRGAGVAEVTCQRCLGSIHAKLAQLQRQPPEIPPRPTEISVVIA